MGTRDGADADLNLATAWEAVAGTVPARTALAHGAYVLTWADFEDRAARLARALAAAGIGTGDKVAIAMHNRPEYLESEFAAFKQRMVPCNVNYRYTTEELHYVLDNADAAVLVHEAGMRDRVAAVRGRLAQLRLVIEVADEVGDRHQPPATVESYEDLIAAHEPAPPISRSGDDLWFLYTGGTTGQPKAVMWDHRGLLGTMASTFGPLGHGVPTTPEEVVAVVRDIASRDAEVRQLAASPLMHGTAGVSTKATLTHGGMVATLPGRSLDAHELWTEVQRHRITLLTIVGDVFGRPMVEALEQAQRRGAPYDLSSLRTIVSSGVMWSDAVKQQLLGHLDVALVDVLGSSEGTGIARQVASRRRRAPSGRFALGEHSRVFTDDGREVEPGSGEVGKLALGFPIPLGYYKDPDKTEATFPQIAGRRWSIPGDHATVEADGTITLLGRGSSCINTGGEKVYPEEVEEVVKTHRDVQDCNVIGLPDPRWGQAVTAVVAPEPGRTIDRDDVVAHVRRHLAAYKAPKQIIVVDAIPRGPNGKPDYRWARRVAEEAIGPTG